MCKLLTTLADQGLDLESPEMNETRRSYLINEIALQTKEYFLPSHQHYCRKGYQSLVSFFKAEATPLQIREAASVIAKAVIESVNRHKSIEEKTLEMVPVSTLDIRVTPHLERVNDVNETETKLIDDELTSPKTSILVQKTGSPSIGILGRKSSASASSNRPASPSLPKLVDDVGDMKISLSIAYRDLEFDQKDKLGTGAYGTVYKGTYKFNDVAIKELHTKHLSQAALEELKQEAGILGSMRSDYIVQLRGICLEAPHYCLVMELMPKGSLFDLLQNSQELPLSVRYRIGLDVCCGLYQLHELNILHRDLKSLNVLLDDRLRAKISDFGLSKVKTEMSGASSTKEMKGTLGWMAPELFAEKPQATTAADIYALGMVLWEMMIKPYHIPFQNMAFTSVLTAKVKRGEQQESIPDSCPSEMADLIKSCWQEADKRPSAAALAKSLSMLFKSASARPSVIQDEKAKTEVIQQDDLLTVSAIGQF